MSSAEAAFGPALSPIERDELGHLDYLLARLRELRDRGLIVPESFETIRAESESRRQAIGRAADYRAALSRATSLSSAQHTEALKWAKKAREIDPERPEAWNLLVRLHWDHEEDREAIEECALAADRFPGMNDELARLRAEEGSRAEARRQRADQAQRDRAISEKLALAKRSLAEHRDSEAVTLCREIFADRPAHTDALALGAFALRRLGQLDPALELYDRLVVAEPKNPAWAEWARKLRSEQSGPPPDRKPSGAGDSNVRAAWSPEAVDPQREPLNVWSWKSFSGEFLKEHWQKLILCVAVLFIVVSSTVGANLLLGDLLWTPMGICAIALVATALFASLGTGLVHWGAARAGRMMLIATLIVVPIHFMLAGELKLISEPASWRYLFLAFDMALLIAMVRWVSGSLAQPRAARFMTAALLLLSIGSAATTRGSPIAWGLQFTAFQLSSVVFLAAVWALGARPWGRTREEHLEFAYVMFGVLGFALLSCLFRAGAYAMRLEPALYSVPAMFTAISLVLASKRLADLEPDTRRLAMLRLGGFSLSALAFALALSRSHMQSALNGGNMLATGLLGAALYVASLRRERHPAYIYLTLGAALMAGMGFSYIIRLRLHLIERFLCWLLGYPEHLPRPFVAIIAIVINLALAWLSFWFVRKWNDRRLERHCHYLGLPISIAACIWSSFEPLAGCICLAGYAILYIAGVWVFSAAWLTYLGVAAVCGSVYFGSTLVPGITLADQALLAALIGVTCWAARAGLSRLHAVEPYRVPWRHATLALAVLAMAVATLGLASRGIGSLTGTGAFFLASLLAIVANRESPRTLWAWLALVSFVELTISLTSLVRGGVELPAQQYGLLFAADALFVLAVFAIMGVVRRRGWQPASGSADPPGLDTFRAAIPRFAIVLTVLADGFSLVSIDRTWLCGVVFLMVAGSYFWLTRVSRERAFVYLGLAQLTAGVLDLAYWAIDRGHSDFVVAWLALVASVLALSYWLAATMGRRSGTSSFFTAPCLDASAVMTVIAAIAAVDARFLGLGGYRLGVAAFGCNAIVSILLSRAWLKAELVYAAVFHFVVATYVVLFSTGNNDPAMAFVLGLAAVIEALFLWAGAILCQNARDAWTASCSRPLAHWALFMTGLAVMLYAHSSLTLFLVAVSFLVAVKGLPRAEWLYGTTAALVAAGYQRWLWRWPAIDLMACALLVGFGFWGLGVLIQRFKPIVCRRLGLAELAYEYPLFHSSIAGGFVAILCRLTLTAGSTAAWTAYAWLPLGLAILCLFMLRAYPRRECLHASLAFLSWFAFSLVAPSMSSACAWTLAGAILAFALVVLERAIRPLEPTICARLGVGDAAYCPVLAHWSLGWFIAASGVAIVVLVDQMGAAIFGRGETMFVLSQLEWWVFVAAFGVLGATLVTAGSDPDGSVFLDSERVLVGIYWLIMSLIWWLGIAVSPFQGLGLPAHVYYPLVTAIAGLATAHFLGRFTHSDAWHDLGWLGDLRSEPLAGVFSIQATAVTLLAVLFTRGVIELPTVLTLVIAALTFGVVALRMGWIAAAVCGGIAWEAACAVAGLVLALRWAPGMEETRSIFASAGLTAAAFVLCGLTGSLRSSRSIAKLAIAGLGLRTQSLRSELAVAAETVALGATLLATCLILFSAARLQMSGGVGNVLGVAVLLAAASFPILLAPRWKAEWLVYLAQLIVLSAYLDFRLTHVRPLSLDAAVLTLFSFFELGAAEILERQGARLFARPVRYFSLVVPALLLIELTGRGQVDNLTLFYVTASAAFYSVACGQLRWKSLGYAAAVLYNAALWILWDRNGWQFSDHLQFFFVPVGLSTILFAEANRRDLGRETVNTIRSAGLLIIYGSLAFPIWQSASFGAWLGLLVASLAGIFLGIGLRLQTFLWLGLVTCVLDVVYEMGRVSRDYEFAKWAIMLSAGIGLVLFVALNEKKKIVTTMQAYWDQARQWE
jgi:tetratricopeptide (TPR) repeat protein